MVSTIISYVTALIIFVAIDFVWLGWIGGPVYRQTLGDILAPNVRLGPAIVFYLIYPLGLVLFAVQPGLGNSQLLQTAMLGALYGFFTYATYDFSNFATLRNWTLGITLMDIAWGCVLGAMTAAITAKASPLIQSGIPGSSL